MRGILMPALVFCLRWKRFCLPEGQPGEDVRLRLVKCYNLLEFIIFSFRIKNVKQFAIRDGVAAVFNIGRDNGHLSRLQ